MPVVLLCHFDGTNGQTTFVDSSPSAHTLTRLNTLTVVTTTSPKFGTGCVDLSASILCGIDTNNAADFHLGSGQFTIEAWVYFTSAPGSGTSGIMSQLSASAGQYGWWFGMLSGNLTFLYSTTGSDVPLFGVAFTPTLNTWYHVAVDRDASNVVRIYVNGVVQTSSTVAATIFPSTATCLIGTDHNARAVAGHLDEARITTGLAQYHGAFTPPTAPFNGAVVAHQYAVSVA